MRDLILNIWNAWKRRRCKHPYARVVETLKQTDWQEADTWRLGPDGIPRVIQCETCHLMVKVSCPNCRHTWLENRTYARKT